ncbi:MAG: cell division protein ZapE [Acetobacterales bacterium]
MTEADDAETPLARYQAMAGAGEIVEDPAQRRAVERLDDLHRRLRGYRPPPARPGLLGRLFGGREDGFPGAQGLYIHGTVGRGKSMLMDLFYASAPVQRKRRVHFHDFMLQVHRRLHDWRRRRREGGRRWLEGDDPIPPLARRIADEAWLICFDEFQVHDITDAMILARLFGALFDHGVVVVATSNTRPDELYKDGLQRENFLPFIDLLKRRLEVFAMDDGRDYRRDRVHGIDVYVTPLGEEAEAKLDEDFRMLTDGARPDADELKVQGRTIPVPEAARGVARFDFAALCARPLGAADYLAIAERYHTVVLSGVPQFDYTLKTEGARFAILIDVLYDHHVRLVCSAAEEPDALYLRDGRSPATDRTVSRLMEMRSRDYLDAPHLAADDAGQGGREQAAQ